DGRWRNDAARETLVRGAGRKKPLAKSSGCCGGRADCSLLGLRTKGIRMLRALLGLTALVAAAATNAQTLPRTPASKADLQGIGQAHGRPADGREYHDAKRLMPAGPSVVDGGEIPYLPAARAQQRMNFEARATADPLNECYLPGVPRIMYLEHPFQIFQ